MESINDREIQMYYLTRKREMFSNDVNIIRKHKNNLKLL